MKKVLVVGASSAIAKACLNIYATEKSTIALIGRNEEKLKIMSADLKVRGASNVEYYACDFFKSQELEALTTKAWNVFSGFDHVLLAHGVLANVSDQKLEDILTAIQINFTSAVVVLNKITHLCDFKMPMAIGVITSPAGDRGRASNYLYGSSKAGLSVYTDGLAHKFAGSAVRITNIKPGFVDTPMTAAFKKGPLWAQPDKVAAKIVQTMSSDFKGIRYIPGFWRVILFIVVHLPKKIFWKTKL